jgi:hypothetical protein
MSASDLRRAIDHAREEFRAALGGAAAVWDQRPAEHGEAAWATRQVAEHVLAAELAYAGGVASALGQERPGWETFTLPAVADALAALDHVAASSRAIMDQVTDQELPVTAPSGATVFEVMQKAARHLEEHARQIRAMSP